jgi:hypothetical protein
MCFIWGPLSHANVLSIKVNVCFCKMGRNFIGAQKCGLRVQRIRRCFLVAFHSMMDFYAYRVGVYRVDVYRVGGCRKCDCIRKR